MADVAVFFVEVSLGVETLDVVSAVADSFEYVCTYSCHDEHVEYNVNGVCELDAVLSEVGAYDTHGVGDNVHCSALHGAAIELCELFVAFLGVHPVVDVAGVFLLGSADECSAFNTSNVVYCCAVEVASGELFGIELDHFACRASFCTEGIGLFFAAVDPYDLVRCAKSSHFVNPIKYVLISCNHN